MPKLLLATGNTGKAREMQALLQDIDIKLITLKECGITFAVVEDGKTYGENAAHKALAYARSSGLLTLADDSGLEVDVLNGAPGIYSARYAPQPGATDADRRAHLLQELRGHPRPWLGRFRCSVALATPEGNLYLAEGECPGEIIPEERGQNGFGYDPIFLLPEIGRTMAELTTEEKNLFSHRARAIRAARPTLLSLL